jgi:hypothetical protein
MQKPITCREAEDILNEIFNQRPRIPREFSLSYYTRGGISDTLYAIDVSTKCDNKTLHAAFLLQNGQTSTFQLQPTHYERNSGANANGKTWESHSMYEGIEKWLNLGVEPKFKQ